MNNKSMGSFLSELRKEKGITQRELAELLNVSDKTVSHWECDEHSPDLSMIPILAEFFGVSCDELIKGERKKNDSSAFSATVSMVAHNSESYVKFQKKEKISKAYTKHKILCILSVFISFFSLAILVGIIMLTEHLTGFYYIKEAVFISVAFAVALCLLITFISSQSFSSVISTAEIPENEKKKMKINSRLNCIFPLIYVTVVLFLIFMVLMPTGSPSMTESVTMTVPTSVEPDTSYFDSSVKIYAETYEFIY